MIEGTKKRRKLFNEILMVVCLCFILALLLFMFLVTFGFALAQEYCFQHDIFMDDIAWYELDNTIRGMGGVVSSFFFLILFFALFSERLTYIRKITAGVDERRKGNYGIRVELAGNNELTELAEAINYLSESEQKIKEKEKRLNEEKEELIRTLSHDIRTPLTSIMSYTELFATKDRLTDEQQQEYLTLVRKKTARIKELTDILLDGGKREVEYFEDARLLFEQLADEFEETLEDVFQLSIVLPVADAFSGSFDIGELRRIFDNLISNIQKYAEPAGKVELTICKNKNGIIIRQSNDVRKMPSLDSHKMGLQSIKRIVQNYGGTIKVNQSEEMFEIIITLSNI